jgi:hypothetical protein
MWETSFARPPWRTSIWIEHQCCESSEWSRNWNFLNHRNYTGIDLGFTAWASVVGLHALQGMILRLGLPVWPSYRLLVYSTLYWYTVYVDLGGHGCSIGNVRLSCMVNPNSAFWLYFSMVCFWLNFANRCAILEDNRYGTRLYSLSKEVLRWSANAVIFSNNLRRIERHAGGHLLCRHIVFLLFNYKCICHPASGGSCVLVRTPILEPRWACHTIQLPWVGVAYKYRLDQNWS